MKGKLIVVEGNDGSGKRTQSELLVKNLKDKGLAVEVVDFPQYYTSFYGRMIAKYLRGEFGSIQDIDPHFASLLYAGDRLEAKPAIAKMLADGKIVIANRYATSNMAFMGARLEDPAKREEFLAWLDELEYSINRIPRPDLVIYLDVPLDISQRWIKSKEKREYLKGKAKDLHEKNLPYLKKVETMYLELASKDKSWRLIRCTRDGNPLPVEEISGLVLKEALSFLE